MGRAGRDRSDGYVHSDFAKVARTFARQLPGRGKPGGAAVCVIHRGEVVVDLWGGTRDGDGHPWQSDTLAVSFSTTKGVASTLLHILIDRGLIDLDQPVARYWPEFAQAGKEAITVRQLMCHEAGLYGIRDMIDHAGHMLDWDTMVQALAAAAPRHRPGTAHGYHALTYGWLAGELVRRVTGLSFAEAVRKEIAEPLGLDGLYCGLPADQIHRRAVLLIPRIGGASRLMRGATRLLGGVGIRVYPDEMASAFFVKGFDRLDFNSPEFAAASMPAFNGMFTARSLARMYAMLAGGGELEGTRLLRPEAVARMEAVQNRGLGRVMPISMQWRLGFHRVFAPGVRAPRAFGHFGFGGSGAMCDPSRGLAIAMVVNSGAGTPVGDTRLIATARAAFSAAEAR